MSGAADGAVRVVCERCGTAYAAEAWKHLRVERWERVGEVLTERRDCLCQSGRMGRDTMKGAVAIPHPESEANVVLVSTPHGGETIHTIARATPRFWIDQDGLKFRRTTGCASGGGFMRPDILAEELPRLEAWAAAGRTR